MPRLSLFFFLLYASTVMTPGDAATPVKDESKAKGGTAFEFNKKDPIYINSDWMEFDQTKNTITYKGRVVTTQGEMTLRSETLTAEYTPDMKQIKQIVAEGKVNATQGNRVATGEKAVFDDQAKTVTLTGNPIMRQGNNQISGSRVIYFVEQDRAVAEGDGKVRVQATIFPDELQMKDKGESAPSN
ncbi:MAG TPA: lipopolysaccharide transport periplasmic protein LptA [Candidatus Binatia bacterium]|nr:lipopolysaccharide transport periplasmic protein LptA [Candidatus Binatia bacterium]